MSASPTPVAPGPLAGTQSPSQIEFLWERYRSLFWVVVLAILGALGAMYGLRYYRQTQTDAKWTWFAEATDLKDTYASSDVNRVPVALSDRIKGLDLAGLEKAAQAPTEESQRPFLLLAVARRAMADANWQRAESALAEIEVKYPNHSLVKATDYPVQVREVKKDPADNPKVATPNKKTEWKPARPGSSVAMMRAQIEAAKAYAAPPQFAAVPIPAEAKKVKFDLSTGGSFTIALMEKEAPLLCAQFLQLAKENDGFWKNLAVDEIQRPTDFSGQPRCMHLGFESTRDDDRTKWTTTDPSKHVVDFESNQLSHFPGAVSARVASDGKACADRFWVVADDAANFDGERVVFGFVVEGLDAVKRVCEESMSAQEEQAGRGRPTANIRVTAVTILP